MSLIIGVKCTDGIVIGTDSAVTLGGITRDTVRQSSKKLQVIGGKVIVASAGHSGLAQRYFGELTCLLKEDKDYSKLPPYRLMAVIQQCFADATNETMRSLSLANAYSQMALNMTLAGTIVAMKSAGELELFSFDEVCNPEYATARLPFTSIGAGRIYAEPFLAHVKRVMWNDEQPALSLGVLGVIWALKHSTLVSPGHLSEPLHIYQMTTDEHGEVRIDELDPDSVRAMEARIVDIEMAMREIATHTLSLVNTPKLPEPPPSVKTPKRRS